MHAFTRGTGRWPSSRPQLLNTHTDNSKIVLVVLATGETAIIDRRRGQEYRVDLRMPVTDEVSLHR